MTPGRLRTLVLHVSTRCDQACAHCGIWRREEATSSAGPASLSDDARVALLEDARAAGASEVLFTGGEPLLSASLERLCRRARELGFQVWIATNGLALGRSPWVLETVDALFVSFEGPEDLHDAVRGRGMWRRLVESLASLRARGSMPSLTARHVLTRSSMGRWLETASAAATLTFDSLSFLAVDAASDAFGGHPATRAALLPETGQIARFRNEITRAAADWPRVLAEGPRDLLALADRMDGLVAPRCNAPEWSVVVESDGKVRPCFFQPAFDRWEEGRSLVSLRREPPAREALLRLSPRDATCRACVCPKWRDGPVRAWARSARDTALGAFS